jgi:hypothetical protein
MKHVFHQFSRYFSDATIYRAVTVRQWWADCAKSVGLKPNFQLHFSHFFDQPPDEVFFFFLLVFEILINLRLHS